MTVDRVSTHCGCGGAGHPRDFALPIYKSVSVNEMQRLTDQSSWAYEDRTEAARMVARARVRELRWARKMNTAKGSLLLLAIIAEVGGIGLLATTLIAILG